MYCRELSYSLGYVSYLEFGFESQLKLSFARRLETASQGLSAFSWNFFVSRVVIRKWLPSGRNSESLIARCRQTSRRHPLGVFYQQLAVEFVMLLQMELCSLKCVDESGKLVLRVGFPIVSQDFCAWVVDDVFSNFFGEWDVPHSPKDVRVSNRRVEDIDLVDYAVFVLLDFDEGFFGAVWIPSLVGLR